MRPREAFLLLAGTFFLIFGLIIKRQSSIHSIIPGDFNIENQANKLSNFLNDWIYIIPLCGLVLIFAACLLAFYHRVSLK